MNSIANIWNHPRTSAAGLLIAVTTVAGVFSQQGVTFGKAGTGTVVALAGAIATALLGLLAKDPAGNPDSSPFRAPVSAGSTAKLGAWMLIVLLLQATWVAGCSGTSVAQNIVNWTPSLESAVAAVDSTASLLAPADAPVFTEATNGFDAASNLLDTQAQAYLANPSASTLTELQNQVVVFQQQVNAALLQTGRIVDSASQKQAITAIQAVATIVTTILSLVQSVSSKTEVARMAAASTIKLAAVQASMDGDLAARMIAAHYSEPLSLAAGQLAQAEQNEIQAGF
ncbi:MAG: hypothetical protein ACRD3N_15515 [Terracidiphilus sp.]